MDLPTLRATELAHQEQALREEFNFWRMQSAKDQRLEKHQSQVEKITRVIELILDKAQIKEIPGETSFARNERLFRHLLTAHRVWAYFRGKFALRFVPWLQPDLVCCDEFAWACYKPSRERAQKAGKVAPENLKEPPLLYFTGESTPYGAARDEPFSPEGITLRDVKDFGAFLLLLPVPVVGVPWFQVQHLPLAVVIGHEVGHIVMDDLGLERQVASALEEAKDELYGHVDEWSTWRREVFADIYGALSAGPAFVFSLMNYLMDEPGVIEDERPEPGSWGDHPPRALRMHLNFEILRQMGFAGHETQMMADIWKAAYPKHAMKDYENELPTVVDRLLGLGFTSFGGDNLRQVIDFTQADHKRANILADKIERNVVLPKSEPFRPLFAAATLAYQHDPVAYAKINEIKTMADRLRVCIPPGVRAAEPAPTEAEVSRIQQGERAVAEKLLALIEA